MGSDEKIAQLEAELEKEEALNRLLLDTDKNQSSTIGHFRKMVVVLLACFTLIICTMTIGFFWYEGQFDVGTTTTDATTTSMETEGTNANINNVADGDMYNDNAVHNNN
jgi:hypothetical protein